MSTPHSTNSVDWLPAPPGNRFSPSDRFPGRRNSSRSQLRRIRAWAPDLTLALAVAVAVALAGCHASPPSPGGAGPGAGGCVEFDSLPVGTSWGGAAGDLPGDVVYTEAGIPVSVHDFEWFSGGTFGEAHDYPWPPGRAVWTNNINLGFDFTGLPSVPTRTTVHFRDLGGFENLSVNGVPIAVGELKSGTWGGVNVLVYSISIGGGRQGVAIFDGPLSQLVIGGQEFAIDWVCTCR